ncbi:MAG TPA: energy transducer TonB [Blastocatellia bacterium]|nr:energy transducer TonB [Blastocatellia bacterium]
MFEKLIISSATRRSGRTIKFFAGTSMTYLLVVASVLAISVMIESPRLADVGTKTILVGPPPKLGRDPRPPADHSGETTSASDSRRPLSLEDIIARASTQQPASPPNFVPIDQRNVGPGHGDGGDPFGIPGGIGPNVGGAGSGGDAPPPPPQVVRTQPAQSQMPQGPVRIPSKVLQGRALTRVAPPYPRPAQQIHVQGSVAVEIIVGVDGRVESARAISGHPLLIRAAVEAARGWRFQPTLLNGVPVQATGVITFIFKLDQ